MLLAVVGAGAFGREIMPYVQRATQKLGANHVKIVSVVEEQYLDSFSDAGVIGLAEFANIACPGEDKRFCIAIADSCARERISGFLESRYILPFDVISDEAVVYGSASIARGVVVCPYSVISAGSIIGKHFHSNFFSYVAHDCMIGDFVTFAPRVTCCGSVVIEDHAYIGAGAVIKQSGDSEVIVIGRGAVVGMGAVVTRSVAPNVTVVGNPARVV
ncbi:MAG: acetyltransferase [Oceanobacter sp.]|nr:MAG: acetyltransferase [Oceanobacter sp.]